MKGGRTLRLRISCSDKNLHKQTSTAFRIFVATSIDVIYPLSLSLSISILRTKRHSRISTQPEMSVSLNWRNRFLFSYISFFYSDILGRIRLIVHLFSREHFDNKRKSKGPLYVGCYIIITLVVISFWLYPF